MIHIKKRKALVCVIFWQEGKEGLIIRHSYVSLHDHCANIKLNWENALVDRKCFKSNKLLAGPNKLFYVLIIEGKPK